MIKSLLSLLYTSVVNRRNKRFDKAHSKHVDSVCVPVFSIGNISVGGTGKTPMTVYITELLKSMGHKPAVLSRGYRRKSTGLVVVSDGQKILVDVETAGDEMFMMATKCQDVVFVVAESRVLGAKHIVTTYTDVDCIILDDGFQHRQLLRDCDIVLIDKRTLEQPHVIPNGILREPLLQAASRADILVAMNGADITAVLPSVKKNVCSVNCVSTIEFPFSSASKLYTTIADFHDRSVTLLAGIANPAKFHSDWLALGLRPSNYITYNDHHTYTLKDILSICQTVQNGGVIITTEKDAVKLTSFQEQFVTRNIELVISPLTLRIDDDFEKFRSKIASVFENYYTLQNP